MPMKVQKEGRDMAPTHFSNPGARTGWMVIAMPRMLYLPKGPRYTFYRILGRPGDGLDRYEKSLSHRGSMPRPFSP